MKTALLADTQRRLSQNLVQKSEGPLDVLTYGGEPTLTNSPASDGFSRWIAFPGPTTSSQYAYSSMPTPLVIGALYSMSAYVRMDDGGAPRPAGEIGPNTDLALVFTGDALTTQIAPQHLGGGLYRILATVIANKTGGNVGVVKYAAQSPRKFQVTGYQVSAGGYPRPYLARS